MVRFNLRITALLVVPTLLAAILAVPSAESAQEARVPKTDAAHQAAPWPPVATFSILGFDPATGEVGGAVQSRVFAVGNGVL